MREILFRGKTDNGKWVEGCLIHVPDYRYTCILQDELEAHPMDYPYLDGDLGTIDGYATPVIPDTIGQYTGLTDKNGKKIFEGDIVVDALDYKKEKQIVDFNEGGFVFVTGYDTMLFQEKDPARYAEVIGNIHDNPELLKEMG